MWRTNVGCFVSLIASLWACGGCGGRSRIGGDGGCGWSLSKWAKGRARCGRPTTMYPGIVSRTGCVTCYGGQRVSEDDFHVGGSILFWPSLPPDAPSQGRSSGRALLHENPLQHAVRCARPNVGSRLCGCHGSWQWAYRGLHQKRLSKFSSIEPLNPYPLAIPSPNLGTRINTG